jgi:D-glycero-D-manno-heptose 1,7-bisphosphate phosphatase
MGSGGLNGPRAVFLDRDGVLNRNVFYPPTGAWEAPHRPEDFAPLPGILSALAQLKAAGFYLFLVSNQPDYALGKASLEAVDAIHRRFVAHLAEASIAFDACYYCYHHPKGVVPGYSGACLCRKPSPHFLLRAQRAFGLDLAASWMVGDRATDVACGRNAGAQTIRVAPGHPAAPDDAGPAADYFALNLAAAAEIILASPSR